MKKKKKKRNGSYLIFFVIKIVLAVYPVRCVKYSRTKLEFFTNVGTQCILGCAVVSRILQLFQFLSGDSDVVFMAQV